METIYTLSKHVSTIVEIDRMLRKALVANAKSAQTNPDSNETASFLDHVVSLSKASKLLLFFFFFLKKKKLFFFKYRFNERIKCFRYFYCCF